MKNPNRAARIAPFPPGYRACGLLLHVTSLPSSYGVGDVGPAAFTWVDRLHDSGQAWWQELPLGPTGYSNSPYHCPSSFAGNGLLISPDLLMEDGLLQADDCREISGTRVLSHAALAMTPLQDLLNLGGEGRMNVPGSVKGNWRWRTTQHMLSAREFQWLGDLTKFSNRSGSVQLPVMEAAS